VEIDCLPVVTLHGGQRHRVFEEPHNGMKLDPVTSDSDDFNKSPRSAQNWGGWPPPMGWPVTPKFFFKFFYCFNFELKIK
jgi:hypothetical protein